MDEKQATSIALLKINLSNLRKGCMGAMDATKASWGVSPSLADPLGQSFPKKSEKNKTAWTTEI